MTKNQKEMIIVSTMTFVALWITPAWFTPWAAVWFGMVFYLFGRNHQDRGAKRLARLQFKQMVQAIMVAKEEQAAAERRAQQAEKQGADERMWN